MSDTITFADTSKRVIYLKAQREQLFGSELVYEISSELKVEDCVTVGEFTRRL
ncbi:hypothetical protein [Paenibacillus sp. RC67]|uniref:hypothetical protein n=1 Tax=Paenibacillus sp. RC67 TaxID=3039392 RepID=UPI0024AE1216|nr:hypothetical protein [Paenibacillus sp. RC67]